MTTDELINLPYQIDYFIARSSNTGKEYDFPEFWSAKSYCDFYNEEGDNWKIYAKIKDVVPILPRKSP